MSLNESDTAGLHSRAEAVHVLEHGRNWALAVLRLCESEDLWPNSAGHWEGSSGERQEELGP